MKLHITKTNDYRIGFLTHITDAQLGALLPLLNTAHDKQEMVLGGRREVLEADIPGMGPVVVKSYARGGLVGVLVKTHYLGMYKIRSLREFEWLTTAKGIGLKVPTPVACVWQGKLVYKCWLVMEDIGPHVTLAQLSLNKDSRAKTLLPDVLQQISLLIRQKIFHVDLHPGNVLIDQNNQMFLIDFDKARFFSGNPEKLRQKYLNRWNRAVRKHGLPLLLNDP